MSGARWSSGVAVVAVGRQWRVTKEQMCGLKEGEENVKVTKDSKRKLKNNVSVRLREGESFTFRSVKAAMEALWGLEKDTPTQQQDWNKRSYDYSFRGVRWRRKLHYRADDHVCAGQKKQLLPQHLFPFSSFVC